MRCPAKIVIVFSLRITNEQRHKGATCPPFPSPLGAYRGYGTRVPTRRIKEAHQEEAQQADSTVRLGQGLTFPTCNRLAES